jgi:hypothetical protein
VALLLVLLLRSIAEGSLARLKASGKQVSSITMPICEALIVLFFFVILEMSLARIHTAVRNPYNLFLPHPLRIWAFDPLTRHPGFTINSMGLRGPEVPLVKTPGEKRILCLGSSITAGNYGIGETQHYPYLLERYLRRKDPGKEFRVINGGVLAYNIYQEMETLFDVYDRTLPDVVILEVTGVYPLMDSFVRRDPTRRNPRLRMLRKLLYSSETFFALRKLIQAHVGVSDRDVPFMEEEVKARFTSHATSLFSTYEYLLAVYLFCRDRGTKLVLFEPYTNAALPTTPVGEEKEIPWEDLPTCKGMGDPGGLCPHVTIFVGSDVLEYLKIPITPPPTVLKIRLSETWKNVPGIEKYMTDNCHPNRAGTRMQARDIGEFLLSHQEKLFR